MIPDVSDLLDRLKDIEGKTFAVPVRDTTFGPDGDNSKLKCIEASMYITFSRYHIVISVCEGVITTKVRRCTGLYFSLPLEKVLKSIEDDSRLVFTVRIVLSFHSRDSLESLESSSFRSLLERSIDPCPYMVLREELPKPTIDFTIYHADSTFDLSVEPSADEAKSLAPDVKTIVRKLNSLVDSHLSEVKVIVLFSDYELVFRKTVDSFDVDIFRMNDGFCSKEADREVEHVLDLIDRHRRHIFKIELELKLPDSSRQKDLTGEFKSVIKDATSMGDDDIEQAFYNDGLAFGCYNDPYGPYSI